MKTNPTKRLAKVILTATSIAMLLLISQTGFSQNNLPAVGDVGIGTMTPSATLDVVGSTKMSGPVAIDSVAVMKDSLRVEGKVVLKQKLEVKGKSTFTKDVSLKQNLSVDSNLSVTGNTTVQGSLILKSPNLSGYTGFLTVSPSGAVGPAPIDNPCNNVFPFWSLQGNSGTTPGTSTNLGLNYIGTCDGEDLSIRTYGLERMRIGAAGNICINGMPSTNVMLHINSKNIIGFCSYTFNDNNYDFNIKAIVDGDGADQTKAFAVLDNKQSTPETFVVYGNGQTIIGNQVPQTGLNANFMLSVDGKIISREVMVQNTDWADYVFKPNYQLMPLEQVAKFIGINKHLPDVPTEADIKKDGNNLGDTQVLLLKKVEELTLYMIQQQQQIKALQTQIDALTKTSTQK